MQQSGALRCSLTMVDSSFDETVDNDPVILKIEAWLMNINEHATMPAKSLGTPPLILPCFAISPSPLEQCCFVVLNSG